MSRVWLTKTSINVDSKCHSYLVYQPDFPGLSLIIFSSWKIENSFNICWNWLYRVYKGQVYLSRNIAFHEYSSIYFINVSVCQLGWTTEFWNQNCWSGGQGYSLSNVGVLCPRTERTFCWVHGTNGESLLKTSVLFTIGLQPTFEYINITVSTLLF